MWVKKEFNFFLESLYMACKNMRDRHYFQLPVAGKEDPVFRERVYCYELYHQLRKILGDNYRYKLDGEVDKNGHPIIRLELGAKKPDFIVHKPGTMIDNLVVIEVKPVNADIGRIKEDMETLKGFIEKADYHYGILLIYGDGKKKLPKRIVKEYHDFLEKYEIVRNGVYLIWHGGPGKRPKIIHK